MDDPPVVSSAGAPGSLVDPRDVFQRWSLAAEDVHEALSRRLVLAFLGSASSGKDSAIRALFGIDIGRIDPIPGSTEEIQVAALDSAGNVLIVNAPGFGDVREEVDQLARQVVEQVDLAVYIVNSDGGASIDERRDLQTIRRLGRPTLVCLNKIDLIRPHQREEFVRTTLAQLGVEEQDAVVCAFDPIPAIAAEPIGVEPVIGWIHGQLEDGGKALLFAKHLRNRELACEALIQAAARRAAMAGALPVPGADITAVTAIQVKLIADIAAVFGKELGRDLALFILGEALAGSSKGFIRWGVEALKAAGWIPGGQLAHLATSALGASISGAATYGVGRATVAYLIKGRLSGPELRRVFDAEAFRWRERREAEDEGA